MMLLMCTVGSNNAKSLLWYLRKKVQQSSHKKAKLLKLKRLSSFLSFYGTQFQNEVENILGARAFCWQNNSLDEQSFQKKKLFFQHTQQVCSAVTAKSFYFFSSTSFQQTRLNFLSFKTDEVRNEEPNQQESKFQNHDEFMFVGN